VLDDLGLGDVRLKDSPVAMGDGDGPSVDLYLVYQAAQG
jgi:hypothetical protein